jgi:DNA-binding CsgD family transcriptional regulator
VHTVGSTIMVERDHELAALDDVCTRARGGHGNVALIEGVAGFGKTALLDAAGQLAQARGLGVLRARGTHLARDIPMELLRGLFGRRLATLSTKQPATVMGGAAGILASALGLAEPSPITDRTLHQATYWLVAELAEHEPTVLLVDDVQWSDRTSLAALVALGNRLDDLPVALILAHRPDADDVVSAALADLSGPAVVRLHPTPLSRAGVATVLRCHLGATGLPDPTIDRAALLTGGNPFLVTEVARALAEASGPLSHAALSELMDDVSQSLSSRLTTRVRRLGQDAVDLAAAVAILGDDCSVGDACAVADLSRERGLRAAAALAGSGVFARARITAFAHPLVRAALSSELLPADRVRLRERAITVLLDAGADDRRVAAHLLHTEPAGSARAVAALRAAAAAASAAAAPARAALLLRRAIAELPATAPAPQLLDATIIAELDAAEFEHAIEHIRLRLASEVTAIERADLVRWLGRAVMQTRGVPAAVEFLDHELEHLEGEARLRVEAEQAWMFMLYPLLSARLADRIARYADLAGRTPGERAMLSMVGLAMSLAPGSSAAIVAPIVARAFGDGALLADEPPGRTVYGIASYALVLTEQFELADRELTRAVQAIGQSGCGGLELVLTTRALTRLHTGRLADAEADGLEAAEAGRPATGSLQRVAQAAALGVVVEARSERGDDAGAMAVLAEYGLVDGLEADPGLRALVPRARAHLAAGRAADALADALRAARSYGGCEDVLNHSASVAALAYAALGDRDAALLAARPHLARARAWGSPVAVATALRVTAIASGGEEGVALLTEAVELIGDTPARMEATRCAIALGGLLRRAGHPAAALDALRRGADLAQQIGARRLAEEARQEMRLLGARPRRLAFSGAEALTAAERRVAHLAAVGRSNRQIAQELYVSPKTVETHLSHAFRKLDIGSRGQLAHALNSLRLDEPGGAPRA